MSPDEPEWIILHCPQCAGVSKYDPRQVAKPTCPACGSALNIHAQPPPPDPHELLDEDGDLQDEEEAETITHAPAVDPIAASQLIVNLGGPESLDPVIDTSRLKSTTDEELLSPAENRIRVKRQSKRVEKELTSWEGDGENVAVGKRRRRRPTPTWVRFSRVAVIAAVPVALVCLVAYGLASSLREKEVDPPEETAADQARSGLSELEAGALEREQSEEIYTRARETAKKFLEAGSWKERLEFVRNPKEIGPLMEKFYADPANEDGPIDHRPIPDSGKVVVFKKLLLFSIESSDYGKRPLALEQISAKEYRVDWESFVGFNEVPWAEIPDLRPTEPFLLRARVQQRAYYNHGFQDDDWISLQLEDRKLEHRIFGYVRRGDGLHLSLSQLTLAKRTPVYILLRVRFPENAPAGDQVEITEVVASGWIAPSAAAADQNEPDAG